MKPLSDTEILLEYTLDAGSPAREELTDGSDAVKILLTFDIATKTLSRVRVSREYFLRELRTELTWNALPSSLTIRRI